MNIELIITKITAWINKVPSDLVAYTSATIVYLNVLSEIIHLGTTILAAALSYLVVEGMKKFIKKRDDKKDSK